VWYLLILVPAVLFAIAGLTGAPYLPARKHDLDEIFAALELKPGQHLLELGCGDGTVLIAAAKRGIASTGYEINPIMVAICWLRTRRYRKLTTVKLANMWQVEWPPADAIYVFLIPRLMSKLNSAIEDSAHKPVRLVSYAFPMPYLKPVVISKNCYGYDYSGLSQTH
jgi:SAM-dependent methyltransferase